MSKKQVARSASVALTLVDKDTPDHRPASEAIVGPIVVLPEVGGLHHRYERIAA